MGDRYGTTIDINRGRLVVFKFAHRNDHRSIEPPNLRILWTLTFQSVDINCAPEGTRAPEEPFIVGLLLLIFITNRREGAFVRDKISEGVAASRYYEVILRKYNSRK